MDEVFLYRIVEKKKIFCCNTQPGDVDPCLLFALNSSNDILCQGALLDACGASESLRETQSDSESFRELQRASESCNRRHWKAYTTFQTYFWAHASPFEKQTQECLCVCLFLCLYVSLCVLCQCYLCVYLSEAPYNPSVTQPSSILVVLARSHCCYL